MRMGSAVRNSELGLLCFAVLVGAAAMAAQEIGRNGTVDGRAWLYPALLLGVGVGGHLAVRRWAARADPLVLPIVVLICGLGLAVVARIDATPGYSADAPHQLVWIGVGGAGFVAVLAWVPDHRSLARYAYTSALAALVLLAAPAFLPTSISEVNGARAWIRFSGFSIQPGEIAKLLLIVFIAAYLVDKRGTLSVVTRPVLGVPLPRLRDVGPLLLAWGASIAILARENEIGFPLLLFGLFLAMLYVATQRFSWVAIGVLLLGVGVYGAFLTVAHVRSRFEIWLHPFAPGAVHGSSYQLVQGLYGLAAGGLFGTGLGRGHPSLVPFSRTDFIIAAYGEELGLVGIFALILLYGLLVSRGLRIALTVRDSFGKLLAIGLASSLAIQVFVVIGGVTRLIPLTGITTPFLSYGGSSIIMNFVGIGLLIRISHAAYSPPEPARHEPDPGVTERIHLADVPRGFPER